MKPPFCIHKLRVLLNYSRRTGHFTWKHTRGPVRAGERAGHETASGRSILLYGREYSTLTLAWFYLHDRWPGRLVVPANGDPSDSSAGNLMLGRRIRIRSPKPSTHENPHPIQIAF